MSTGAEEHEDAVFVHKQCGFPIYAGEDGNWHHVEPSDGVFCDLLFSGGSMLDALLEEGE